MKKFVKFEFSIYGEGRLIRPMQLFRSPDTLTTPCAQLQGGVAFTIGLYHGLINRAYSISGVLLQDVVPLSIWSLNKRELQKLPKKLQPV